MDSHFNIARSQLQGLRLVAAGAAPANPSQGPCATLTRMPAVTVARIDTAAGAAQTPQSHAPSGCCHNTGKLCQDSGAQMAPVQRNWQPFDDDSHSPTPLAPARVRQGAPSRYQLRTCRGLRWRNRRVTITIVALIRRGSELDRATA